MSWKPRSQETKSDKVGCDDDVDDNPGTRKLRIVHEVVNSLDCAAVLSLPQTPRPPSNDRRS